MKGGKGRENIFCKPTASMRYSHECAVEQFQSTGIGRLVKKYNSIRRNDQLEELKLPLR